MADKIWFIVVALGPVLLGCIIAYALMRRRRLNTTEVVEQKEAMEQLYDKPEGGREPTFHQR
ncbi:MULTISPECIES: hypothetical protein [Pseudorhizobium]|jgi:hypothetical protein|uniref:Uncharacterized protein n=1 Tax=Pseudorhizobium pelagicum TaxID=1509405 RepID=A0A922P447_9HYPH|nr:MULTISPECIES: hypothetical protein [Pseudorhizobium]MBU1316896.1 hypothetical protein [Alphaproteobacteria bacterium]KEQ07694.1 hypothetical protein GV67_20015 [Pseudorhizobium pelagicum]KEQ10551.1 hypothetical protein GV68_09805 [Pseudorhizobium pelagicum]MBU1548185.1 hypothetical protein [Alphaproteobacteria bacterium]MBU2336053.1 hypothetical protein [Alphaproteobacteria bacterium]|tara:strand:+ start:2401 stop:2586 length:186 start_codon:yes stop_codon:yes gene_type:complete